MRRSDALRSVTTARTGEAESAGVQLARRRRAHSSNSSSSGRAARPRMTLSPCSAGDLGEEGRLSASAVDVKAEVQGHAELPTVASNNSSKAMWAKAASGVKASLAMSAGFKTLRDQTGINDVAQHELKVIKKLGEGAFATVEKCEFSPTSGNGQVAGRKQVVAVKRLKPEITSDPQELQAFMHECSLLRKLRHGNIVAYVGLGCSDDSSEERARSTAFLVEEFMGGGTLKQLVVKQMQTAQRLYTDQDALRWATHVASALAYLHGCIPIVIHRDLKLENILLSEDRQVAKVADFGLAAVTRRAAVARMSQAGAAVKPESDAVYTQRISTYARTSTVARTSTLARASSLVRVSSLVRGKGVGGALNQAPVVKDQMSGRTGTLMYMAPEMFRGDKYDEKVDVFSFGIIMYELFSRYLTIFAISNAGTEAEIEAYASRIASGFRPPLSESWPSGLRAVISGCWAQEPNDRPTMAQVHARLEALASYGDFTFTDAGGSGGGCECVVS